jgi:hypothetical protein
MIDPEAEGRKVPLKLRGYNTSDKALHPGRLQIMGLFVPEGLS